jgi:leucine dehydrogenase
MTVIRELSGQEHEHVFQFQDDATGLTGFLAIHNTHLGPAFGGIRIRPYRAELPALSDALRLSRAMTYKTALAELPCGGGKAVLVDHPELRRDAAFEEFGRLVEMCGGQFFTGPDVGTWPEDLQAVRRATKYCAEDSSPELGDIAEHTAIGVWHGMRACLDAAGIEHPRVAIQGVGNVGMHLGRILHHGGFELTVADIDRDRASTAAQDLGARVVSSDEILTCECDVLAPCAVGAVMNMYSVPKLRAKIVCGSANNVLASPEDGDALRKRGIIYAPDYLANAGGVIRGAEYYLLGVRDSQPSLIRIYDRMKRVLDLSRERDCSTARIADELAEARWKGARPVQAQA